MDWIKERYQNGTLNIYDMMGNCLRVSISKHQNGTSGCPYPNHISFSICADNNEKLSFLKIIYIYTILSQPSAGDGFSEAFC